ncbi:hypothetical protein D9615_009319 [Tricholomella constricta]|uniref:PHP domain-like protein n=1 Tax=Tricholomella constricta TaxID=117010 RepID=A0A8H5LWN5_9AGAR|nr:hypothetical protein D9615_009319 [Tricholomella constricta]
MPRGKQYLYSECGVKRSPQSVSSRYYYLSHSTSGPAMYFDLNVPIPNVAQTSAQGPSKKGKGKQQQPPPPSSSSSSVPLFSASQLSGVEARVDLLVRLGYTVIAFNQVVHKKVDPKIHVNTADSLVRQLRRRPGIVYLKRLSIILDEDSEKGFGLTNANASLFPSYDLIGLIPLTQASFSLACLTHSMPSPLTAHIIALPLTLPRLAFHLKHTLVRTAIKNGAVFEISYVGALGGENDPVLVSAGAAENGAGAKRNWWAAAKELVRVTKGRNVIVSGGVVSEADLRAPADVGNLITLLGLAQDVAHASLTKVPKSLVLRAQTRNTYRAVFSEPTVIIPEGTELSTPPIEVTAEPQTASSGDLTPADSAAVSSGGGSSQPVKKRPRAEEAEAAGPAGSTPGTGTGTGDVQKKRRRKNKDKGDQLAQG